MIKGIRRIKGLGVFDDFTPGADTSDFGSKNLIYGWNYSGKTTLSRLVSLLERKSLPPDLPAFTFSIDTEHGVLTEANYAASPIVARVFNSDFIAENLNFAGSSFKPILLLGADSDKAQKEIETLEEELKSARAASDLRIKSVVANKKNMDAAKTSASAAIKTALGLVEAFGSTQLDKQVGLARVDPVAFKLSETAIQTTLKVARAKQEDRLPPLTRVALPLTLDAALAEIPALLSKVPDMAHTLEHLAQHPIIEGWIGTGLSLHEGKDACEFCGGALDQTRLASFAAHFSKDLMTHKQSLSNLRSKLAGIELAYSAPKDPEVEPAYRAKLTAAIEPLQAAIKAYNQAIIAAIADVDRKSRAPFTALAKTPTPDGLEKAIGDAVAGLNAVIDANNGAFKNFSTDQANAIGTLKLHFAQAFSVDKKLDGHDRRQTRLANCAKAYDDKATKMAERVQKLKAIISQSQLGREEINKRIHSLLGMNSVHIDVALVEGEERFQLLRANKKPAKHLSEGEKTAIAFSYFLTRLGEIKKLDEAIIYIDDPISSLDSNHIFQVNAIIKEAFFHQEKPGGPWKTRCKQIFLSTHNFEFFSLMRELKPDNNNISRQYLIKRVSHGVSTFSDLPKSLSQYSSEYHFLFGVLDEFHKAPDKKDFRILMMLPNAARRFLELYTYARYPDSRGGTVDQRADRIFGEVRSKRILKVLHHFSHANNIERLAENNELMCDIEEAVKELMEALQEDDPMHMEGLRAAMAP